MAVPRIGRLIVGMWPRKSNLAPGTVNVSFVVDRVALGRVILLCTHLLLAVLFHQCSILLFTFIYMLSYQKYKWTKSGYHPKEMLYLKSRSVEKKLLVLSL